jgi:hypothetical protein
MPHARLRRALLLTALAGALLATSAPAALIQVDGLVLRADGGFQPQTLPRHGYAPIDFQGYFDISAKNGSPTPVLQEALIDFDRDGRLDVAGLPTCDPSRIAAASTQQARSICAGAQVGTGRLQATVALGGGSVRVNAPLTIFNGPRQDGNPTAIFHSQTSVPTTQTYAIVVPIERRQGGFRYRVRIVVPPIAEGRGALTGLRVAIGRHYRAGGHDHSYVSARCSDNVLKTHGHFSFQSGTIIDGSVEKYCRVA